MQTKRQPVIENALIILDKLLEARTTGGIRQMGVGELKARLDMAEVSFYEALQYLKGNGLIETTMGGDQGIMWATSRAVDYLEAQRSAAPQVQIGAIFTGDVSASNIQAIASAVNSTISQAVYPTASEEVRKAISSAVEDMVAQVKAELSVKELLEYTRLAEKLQTEVAKDSPDPSIMRKLLSGLSFLGDIEGFLSLGERGLRLASSVMPYVPIIIALLNKL